jgi:hypothetical protein
MPTYVQADKSDVWHWCRNCEDYPLNPARRQFFPGDSHPLDGELCGECGASERDGTCEDGLSVV